MCKESKSVKPIKPIKPIKPGCRNSKFRNGKEDDSYMPKKMTPLGATVKLKDKCGNKETFLVAQLVAEQFVEKTPEQKANKCRVVRIDGDITNDRADNLRWELL